MQIARVLLLSGCCLSGTTGLLQAQHLLLDISPRVMTTWLYADQASAQSGTMPLLAVSIFPKPHFGIGFYGTASRNFTTTGIEFVGTSDRNRFVNVYGLASVYFIESNLTTKHGVDMSTIGFGLGLGGGVSLKVHQNVAINLIEITYQNNLLAGEYLFSDSTPAKHAVSIEAGMSFRLIDIKK